MYRYAAERDALLQAFETGLRGDERVIATWLAGSIGRGQGDGSSDPDRWVVIRNDAAARIADDPSAFVNGIVPTDPGYRRANECTRWRRIPVDLDRWRTWSSEDGLVVATGEGCDTAEKFGPPVRTSAHSDIRRSSDPCRRCARTGNRCDDS